jgi:hypothetical protein
MSRAAEGTHWYDSEGNPRYTLIGKNGKERNTTLRDARKLNLVPSVTSVLSIAAKPGLERWKINQALLSALTLPQMEGESLDDFMARSLEDSREQAIQAAARGTEIHAEIEEGFATGIQSEAYKAMRSYLDNLFNVDDWMAERSFCSPLGYGGKVDLYSPTAGIVVDFKTKDNLENQEAKRLVYDEHGMQLSAYSLGLGIAAPIRISIFIDRSDPNIIKSHEWDIDTHPRHLLMFSTLLNYWQLLKNYYPNEE